jgi:hypothetical protein
MKTELYQKRRMSLTKPRWIEIISAVARHGTIKEDNGVYCVSNEAQALVAITALSFRI